MSKIGEPSDPIEQYQLADADRELIAAVDFRLNNNFIVFFDKVAHLASDPTGPKLLEYLQQFKDYINERVGAIYDTTDQLKKSPNPDLHHLATTMHEISQQLMSMTGAIGQFLREPSGHLANWTIDTVADAYKRMKPNIDNVARNPAYQAYKTYIKAHDLEAGRTTFHYISPKQV